MKNRLQFDLPINVPSLTFLFTILTFILLNMVLLFYFIMVLYILLYMVLYILLNMVLLFYFIMVLCNQGP